MTPSANTPRDAARRILIVGTGGQGVLTCARLLGECLVELGHHVVSGQLHGMAQRGGSVQSCVLVDAGDSPVIPDGGADFVIGFEPIETARALASMSGHTIVSMNTATITPFVLAQAFVQKKGDGRYPAVEGLVEQIRSVAPNVLTFDATQCAIKAGSIKSMNLVMLGCLLGSGVLPVAPEAFWDLARRRLPEAALEANARAFVMGTRLASDFQPCGTARP